MPNGISEKALHSLQEWWQREATFLNGPTDGSDSFQKQLMDKVPGASKMVPPPLCSDDVLGGNPDDDPCIGSF